MIRGVTYQQAADLEDTSNKNIVLFFAEELLKVHEGAKIYTVFNKGLRLKLRSNEIVKGSKLASETLNVLQDHGYL